ncbi:cytosolic carboxypeptidase 1-like isoform X2 [Bolinopsis microptera]|uniref:cytosolic carboxypeptidase 1-like isoform X2 n=1 Tax=Bolinopsis microptera TaxID=2820187 RepID=UPI00307ACCF5
MSNPKPSSSRVSGLLQVIERSAGTGLDDKNVENVSQATAKILRMLGQQEKTLTESILRKSKVSQSLVTLLMTTQDVALHLNTVHILVHIASSSNSKCTRLVRQGAPHALLRSVAATSRVRPLLEELCLHQHLLLIKLATKEKKLALKARLCGVVTVTLDLAKQCINNIDLSSPLLQVLKIYATNHSNSLSLVKNGVLNLIERYFSMYGKQNIAVFRYALELYTQVLAIRANAVKAAANGATRRMLDLFNYWTDLDKLHKFVHIRKSILNSIKHLVGNESGRKSLIKCDGISILYATAKQSDEMKQEIQRNCSTHTSSDFKLRVTVNTQDIYKKTDTTNPNGKAIDNLALTCSQIIRKSMPKVCLPIPSLHGPVYFDESSLDPTDPYLLQEYKEDGYEDEDEAPAEEVPLTLTNVEDFLKFFPELTDYQNNKVILDQLSEYRKEFITLVPQTPSNSQNELSDERSDTGPISVIVKPVLQNGSSQSIRSQSSPKSSGSDPLRKISNSCDPNLPPSVTSKRSCRNVKSVTNSLSNMSLGDSPVLTASYSPPPAKAVKHFAKVAAPDMYSHRPPHYLEQLYDPIQSVQRTLMLLDIARAVHPETLINRIAYDQDELVKTEEPSNHALSNIKWDPALRRCKILPSIPQTRLNADPPLDVLSQHMNEENSTGTVNIPILQFESRHECGNLRKAIQVRIFEYDLVLNSDIGSTRHHQWFYFEVHNMVADFPYRFNIINCEKSCSSFTQGMQPLLYSAHDALTNGTGWQRCGKRICYYKNNFVRKATEDTGRASAAQNMHTLTFTICFPHSHDTCYIAYHYPYSYSSLQAHLLEVQHLHGISSVLRRQTLCTSIGGNPVDLLTITQFSPSHNKSSANSINDREYVVLSARVHPGESNSSWIMKGVINFLISDSEKAQQLRNKFVFKIIPMLNPDGVINGSHRCSLLGVDMNRQWINPHPNLYPTLYHTKGVIQLLVALGKRPVLYCDFHGHSRKKNVFMYGNITQPADNATVKLLPTILDIHAPAFSFSNCCFTVEKSRESTARVALWRQFGITRSYTLESSYCGADQGLYKGCQLGTQHLEEMGAKFCEGILIMSSADQPCCLSDETDEDEDSYFSSDSDDSEDDDDSSAE